MDNGAWGVLESTIPPATCPAWPSMLTGKKPEKLGLYYFTRRDTKSYQPRINKITFDGSIWQILTNYGKRCYVINIPLTELPKKDELKAVFIAGPIMHAEEITNQPRIRSLIKETGYQVDPPMFEEGKKKLI